MRKELNTEWRQLERTEADGLAAVRAVRLHKGDLLLAQVPMGRMGTAANTHAQLAELSAGLHISVDTADQYRRVAHWYGPERRDQVVTAPVVASYTVMREAALHTHGGLSSEDRLAALLAALHEAARQGRPHITSRDYREQLGVPQQGSEPTQRVRQVLETIASDENVRAHVVDAVSTDPLVATAVLRTLVESPAGPETFFEQLSAEGGLEALKSASSALRKATDEARMREEAIFGKEEDPSPTEEVLRLILRAMKALEKPMGLDPSQVVQALPPEQFAALQRLCGSVNQWHEVLLHAAQATNHQKGKAA
ncbi:hypothetical protein [Streptomyces sp. NPDC059893]|uniref:hypothetical protein n=1 Tax=Streptomyces sp. NPDC059893 TaxID=3346990 RepID=UPI00364B6934